MRVVIFTRALGYLNEENEGLFVVQRGKAGLNWVEWSGDVKSAGSKGSMATAVAFSPYFLNPPLTLRLLAKGDIPHASFVLLLQPLLNTLSMERNPRLGSRGTFLKGTSIKRTFSELTCVDLYSELSELFSSSVSPAGVWEEEMSNSVGFP